MKNYGTQRSLVRPEPVEVNETTVFTAENIRKVTETVEGQELDAYEFTLTQYEKDEYIELISRKNAELEESITDTQLALCEFYEMTEGGR